MEGLLGHSRSFRWQFTHEVMVNENFMFSTYGNIFPDKRIGRSIELLLRKMDHRNQIEFENSIIVIASGNSDQSHINNVDRSLCQLRKVLMAVTNEKKPSECLETSLLIQMLSAGAYGPKQLQTLIDYVVAECTVKTSSLKTWYVSVTDQIGVADDLYHLAATVIHELTWELQKLRASEMNKRLIKARPHIRAGGAEYESLCILNGIASKEMTIDRTILWITRAKDRVGDGSDVKVVHRDAMKELLMTLSFTNGYNIQTELLPETLTLDSSRINTVRLEIQKLAIAQTAWRMVTMATSEDYSLEEILTSVECGGNEVIDNLSELIQSVPAVYSSCVSTTPGSVRYIYTARIAESVLEINNYTLSVAVDERIRKIRVEFVKLLEYIEMIYGQLYSMMI